MKKIIIIFIFLILLYNISLCSCYIYNEQVINLYYGSYYNIQAVYPSSDSHFQAVASNFIVYNNCTLYNAKFLLQRVSVPSYEISSYLCDTSYNILVESDDFDESTLVNDWGVYTFTFTSINYTLSTTEEYIIIICASGGVIDTSHYFRVAYCQNYYSDGNIRRYFSGSWQIISSLDMGFGINSYVESELNSVGYTEENLKEYFIIGIIIIIIIVVCVYLILEREVKK